MAINLFVLCFLYLILVHYILNKNSLNGFTNSNPQKPCAPIARETCNAQLSPHK